MLRSVLVLLAMTLCCWSTLSQANKCDQKVIDFIKEKFWNHGHCIPRDIIRTGIFWKTEIIVRTTADYYVEEKSIICAYTNFSKSTVTLFVKYEKSSGLPDTMTEVFNISERDGVLFDEARGEYRYYLYSNKLGVRAFYKCSDDGKTGAPEGLIEVSRLGYDEEALAESRMDLESLGIELSNKMYQSDHCAA